MEHKLDKVFGPSGAFAGYVLILTGVPAFFFMENPVSALIPILIGAFVAFSTTGTQVDLELRKVRSYTAYFGFLRSGKWQNLDLYDQIQVAKPVIHYRTYSRSNRSLDIYKKDYRIMLLGNHLKLRVPLQKFKSYEHADREAEKISALLNIPYLKSEKHKDSM
ncbi:MAG: hypothetical protein U9N53_14070 [Bacteroidota bacterium]|nr:hypothetical protein [Bacteroidota bacterium]